MEKRYRIFKKSEVLIATLPTLLTLISIICFDKRLIALQLLYVGRNLSVGSIGKYCCCDIIYLEDILLFTHIHPKTVPASLFSI